jgi:hypothetical protein
MRSRIDARWWEWVARVVVMTTLAVLLWRASGSRPEGRAERIQGSELRAALERWTRGVQPAAVHVSLRDVPAPLERDWLAALRRPGSAVTWSGTLDAVGVEALATAEPRARYLIRAAGPRTGSVHVSDDFRAIATAGFEAGIMSVRTATLAGVVRADAGLASAWSPAPSPPVVKRIALIGPAGWETKFVAAALEESGWAVDARIGVAPGVAVGTLQPSALDTLRYSVGIVVDAVSGDWQQALARFVSRGGGLVVAGQALRAPQFATLLPARVTRAVPARDTSVAALEALAVLELASAPHGVALETRGEAVVLAAGRFGAGRVVASGYQDTWRWRMQGDEQAVRQHRDWWSALASAAAHAVDTAAVPAPESAPVAALVNAIGPATEPPADAGERSRVPLDALLFALLVAALLGETFSRRRRGLA